VDKVEIGLAPIAIENGKYRIKKIYTGESSDLSSPLSGPVSILKLVIIIGCEWCSANTEKNLYSYFAKTAGRQITFCKQYPILRAKEFTVVPVSEVNLRQQDWVETNRRKVDKLTASWHMFGYQIQGKAATQISTVTILPKRTKKEPSLMSDLIMGTDCRLHHRCAFKRSSWLF
jgi:hypothetical protein